MKDNTIIDNFMNYAVENIAKVCHQANKAFCEVLGGYSRVTWELSSESNKKDVIHGVNFIIQNPNAEPDALHVSWINQKCQDGWVHGEIEDAYAKTHPCIVPFDQLPKEEQTKYILFKNVVDGILFLTPLNKS